MARMQQQFEAGKNTDTVIRVCVASEEQDEGQQTPAPKRPRMAGAASSSTEAAAAAADQYTDINAHWLLLCARSAYFEKALDGGWTEAAERRVELVVDDEQAVEDLRLLIKLAYSDSYTHDGGQLLPLDTRLRLAALADALEFVEAADQVLKSLPLGLGLEGGGVTCLGDLPPVLEAHPDLAAIRQQVIPIVIKGIEDWEETEADETEALVQRAVDALARYLGPVHEMFEQRATSHANCLPLRKDVVQLPLCVFKRLLTSEALQLQSENEAYRLLQERLMYVSRRAAGPASRDAVYKDLAPLLRYPHMTPDFLLNVVAACPMRVRSGLSSVTMGRAARAALVEDRGVPSSEARWQIEASLSLEEVMQLEPGGLRNKRWGLVAGYRIAMAISRDKDADTLGVAFSIHNLTRSTGPRGAALDRCPVELGVRLGAFPRRDARMALRLQGLPLHREGRV